MLKSDKISCDLRYSTNFLNDPRKSSFITSRMSDDIGAITDCCIKRQANCLLTRHISNNDSPLKEEQ